MFRVTARTAAFVCDVNYALFLRHAKALFPNKTRIRKNYWFSMQEIDKVRGSLKKNKTAAELAEIRKKYKDKRQLDSAICFMAGRLADEILRSEK